MLIVTSLPKWETSHCSEDHELVFPDGRRRGITPELRTGAMSVWWWQLTTCVCRLAFSRRWHWSGIVGIVVSWFVLPQCTPQTRAAWKWPVVMHDFNLCGGVFCICENLPPPVPCNTSTHTLMLGRWPCLSSECSLLPGWSLFGVGHLEISGST